MIVDEMHHNHPELLRDQYWNGLPDELPYPDQGQHLRDGPPEPSTAKVVKVNLSAATVDVSLLNEQFVLYNLLIF